MDSLNDFLIENAIEDVHSEILDAMEKHPTALHSAHEGYAVLLEEVRELEREVFDRSADKERMRAEAVQVAAMAIRLIVEVLD